VAIGNAIFVRDRNSLTKNEQPMRSFAIQTGPDGTKLEWPASQRLESNLQKYRGMTYCFAFFRVGQLEIKFPPRRPATCQLE
jgi:hypothetical protein